MKPKDVLATQYNKYLQGVRTEEAHGITTTVIEVTPNGRAQIVYKGINGEGRVTAEMSKRMIRRKTSPGNQ